MPPPVLGGRAFYLSFALCASHYPALQNLQCRSHLGLPRAFHVVGSLLEVLRRCLCRRYLSKILSWHILQPRLRISCPTSMMISDMTSCFCFFFFLQRFQSSHNCSFQREPAVLTRQLRRFALRTTRLTAAGARTRAFQRSF